MTRIACIILISSFVAAGCHHGGSGGGSSSGGKSSSSGSSGKPSTPPPPPPTPGPSAPKVLAPNGGEYWVIGLPATVTWTPGVAGSPVNIELSTDGVSWSPLALGTGNDGSEAVVVPTTPSSTARVRVTETSTGLIDTSDGIFQIRPQWEDLSTGVTGTRYGAMAWGDYDNDGDLDLVVAGKPPTSTTRICRIYRNDGGGVFTDIVAPLPATEQCAFAWGDYDGDGDLDLALAGYIGEGPTALAKIYRNDGSDTFVDTATPLPGLGAAALAWGDFDGDGDLDLAMAGFSTTLGTLTKIMRNDGGGTFTDSGIPLPGVYQGALCWGDYDNDGDLDLAMAGYEDSASWALCRIYRNDGGGVFTDIAAGLPPVYTSTIAWGDYDHDGDLDLAVAGWLSPGTTRITRIYRNDGALGFNDIVAGLKGTYFGWLSWGDYDNDGDLDLAVTGSDAFGITAMIYRYDGGTIFTDSAAPLDPVFEGSTVWGDFDGDGDLDLAYNGGAGASGDGVTHLYRNNFAPANAPPSSPGSPGATTAVGSVTLSWSAAADDHTPAAGLSYNIRIGTAPGVGNVVPPLSDPATGTRRVPQMGFIRGTSKTFSLPPGTYFWSIQAVDSAFLGGAWSVEGSFTVP